MWGTPELFAHKSAVMTRACADAGRDPATWWRSTQALIVLGRYAEAGLDELVVTDGHLGGDPARPRELLDVKAREVVGSAR